MYSRELKDQKQDRNLLAGFLTAINQFAANISDGKTIKQIVIGDSTLSFKIKNNLILVIRQTNSHHSIIQRISNEIVDKFIELYSSQLDNFNGEIGIFKNFDSHVDDILSKDYEVDDGFEDFEVVTDIFKDHLLHGDTLDEIKIEEDEETLCKICLMEIEQDDYNIRYCQNGHPAHEECFLEWTKHSYRCPFCNAEYSEESIKDMNGFSLI